MKNEIRKCNSCGIPISEYERRRRDSLGLLVCHYCFMHPKFPTGSPVTASQAVDVEKATSVEEGEQTYDTTHGRIAVQRGTVLTAYLRGKTRDRKPISLGGGFLVVLNKEVETIGTQSIFSFQVIESPRATTIESHYHATIDPMHVAVVSDVE